MRRRDEEPANPFAQASSRSTKKTTPGKKPQRQPVKRKPTPPKPVDTRAEIARKQKEAIERMKGQTEQKSTGPAKAGGGERSKQTKNAIPEKTVIKQETRQNRLADLERKKKTMEGNISVQPANPSKLHDSVTTPSEEAIASVLPPAEPVNIFSPKARKSSKNQKPTSSTRPRRRGAREKKGGGRQPQVRKLDRRKYLEYKYEVRGLLDDPAIPEENRSNILGQVWAKGERTGIEEAIQFIETKEAELILPKEIADKLRELVKGYATRR